MDGSDKKLRELEPLIEADPGAPGFPALAELYRRDGRLADAERVIRRGLEQRPDARDAGVVLSLTLLDQGQAESARATLEALASDALTAAGLVEDSDEPIAPASELSDAEFDAAFDQAEPDADRLIDPDSVAEEAVARVDSRDSGVPGEHPLTSEIGSSGLFATRSMAELLERQGDSGGAAQIRATLGGDPVAPSEMHESESGDEAWRQSTVQALESWLQNLRGVER